MKHAPHRVRLCRYNSGGDRPFQRAALDSNAAASVFCGWQNQERCGSQTAAQLVSKAGFAANLYTAKRMIQCLHFLDIKLVIIKLKS
jgi:hypothetical protein